MYFGQFFFSNFWLGIGGGGQDTPVPKKILLNRFYYTWAWWPSWPCDLDYLYIYIYIYLRDDIDFLNYLPKHFNEHALLVTFDVVSLYSNIPHDLGRKAIEFWLDRHPDLIHSRFSKEFILEGLSIILENNNFSFNESFFNQRKGCTMGAKVSPTYATLVLGY